MTEERYALKKQLGAGGMGDVWLATDTLLDRPVAVKFLQATKDPRHKDLFLSEARTLARLHHPNITTIYDAVFDEKENRFYIMMEYVEGKSLADMIDEAIDPLPLDTIFSITIGMLRALSYAHNKGFVHRDIKPDNVVIQQDEVKLTDFGLAELASILSQQNEGYIVGTPFYMSPEQIASEGVDGRSDLYSLGVTLFEMVTGGHRPFSGDPRDILTAHIENNPPSVREFAPNTPLMLERIIAKLLAKYPDERYDSADTLLDIFVAMQARQKFSQRHMQLLDPSARPLAGRADELKRLETVWDDVQSSANSRLVAVKGKMGMGKSRLISEFLGTSVIDRGGVVAVGRCSEIDVSYAPYAEILATIFDRGLVKPATIEHKLDYLVDQIPSLAPLLNIEQSTSAEDTLQKSRTSSAGLWKTLSSRVPDNVSENPAQAQWQFFATVTAIFVELGPSVIFLDDAAHLDESSIALTRFLAKQELPVMIVAEVRENGQENAWVQTFPSEELTMLELAPLSTESVKECLVNFLEGDVDQAIVRIVEKQSRGNPFHIEEAARQLVDTGEFYKSENGEWRYQPPASMTDLTHNLVSAHLVSALTRRLEKLSQESRDLLALAALTESGPEFDFDIWVALLGGESKRVAAQTAVDEALKHRLLRSLGDNRYVFRPADVAASLTEPLSAARKREIHQQAAEVLKTIDGKPILIGYHYEQAGLSTEAAQYLEIAGEQAMAANALNQAIDYYNRAVKLVASATAYQALGNLYRQQGDWAQSEAAFEQALALVKKKNDVKQQATVLNGLIFTLWLSDQYRKAAEVGSVVLKLAGVSATERATTYSHLGMISWLLGHLKEAEEWCLKAVDGLLNSDDKSKLAEAYNRLGLVYFTRGNYTDAQKVANYSRALRQRLGQQWGEAYCHVALGQIAADQGQFNEAQDQFATARELFEAIQSNDGLMVVNTEEGRSLLLQGQVNEAILLLNRALHLAQDLNKRSAYGLGDIYLLIAWASLELGEIERADASATNALNLVEAAGNQKYIAMGRAILAQIQATRGETIIADATFKRAIVLFDKVGYPAGLLRTKLRYARFLANRGNIDTAAHMEQHTREEAAKIGLFLN